ncbi:fibrinogen-binding adhesin SdrG C-terminal domain-containing protein [Staphylococcus aureus]
MKSNLRYGIRKHKLGAASVFLGTMIVVGMGQEKEAAASEENNTTVEESGSSATERKASETQTTTNNVNTIDETQSYSATSTEQPSQSTQVTTEEAPITVQAPKTVEVKLGENKISKKFDIKYLEGVKDRMGVTVNGRIDTLNKEDGKFSHFAYIKPNNRSLSSVTVTGQVTAGYKQNAKNPTVKVYKHIGSDELAESVYAKLDDASKFENVTEKVNLSYTGEGGYSFTFDSLEDNDNYVVKYEGEFNTEAKDLNFQTRLTGYHNYYPYYPYYPVQLTWNNGVAFYSNSAQGDGKDKPKEPIIEHSTPIELEFKSEPPVEKHELTGTIEESNDSKPIDFEYHTAVEGAEGHAEGIVETEEDTIHVDFEESTHENSKHHADVVEYEEDTNPGGGQVTTESNLVEFDEESTKGIVTGAVSDHTTIEDTKEYTTESNLIELVDELPEEHGQAQGPIEEITENNHHVSHSGLGTENGHGNYGVIEEIEENSHVDIKSELGYEGGQNSGNQSFEEDTEEDKPKYEQGGNIVDIDLPTPEVPSEPKTPTPPTPEVPTEPGKPVPPAKEEPKKPSKPVEQGKVVTPVIEINEKVKAVAPTKKAQSKQSELPETGGEESTNKGMLFGGIFSILGLALLRRNKKNHKA